MLPKYHVAIPSQDVKETRKGVEICVVYDPYRTCNSIPEFLSKKAEDLGLPFRKFELQPSYQAVTMTDEQLEYTKSLGQKYDDSINLDEKFFRELVSELESVQLDVSNKDYIGAFVDLPSSQDAKPIPLVREKVNRLKNLRGKELEQALKRMTEDLELASKAPKTAWATFFMIGAGIGGVIGYALKLKELWVGRVALMGKAIAAWESMSVWLGATFGSKCFPSTTLSELFRQDSQQNSS